MCQRKWREEIVARADTATSIAAEKWLCSTVEADPHRAGTLPLNPLDDVALFIFHNSFKCDSITDGWLSSWMLK